MMKKRDVVALKRKNDFRNVVLKHLLKNFKNKLMIQVVPTLPTSYPKGISKLALSDTIDKTSEEIVNILIKQNLKNLKTLKPVDGKIIKPLYLFLDKEVLLYAKLKKLKFGKIQKNKASFLDELEKKHPEIKRAVVSSYLEYNVI